MTSSRCKPHSFDYFLCNQKLSTVGSNPHLGVEIARTLSWNNHINNIVKRANTVMGLVKRNHYSAPKETKILAYQSIVRPTFGMGPVHNQKYLQSGKYTEISS